MVLVFLTRFNCCYLYDEPFLSFSFIPLSFYNHILVNRGTIPRSVCDQVSKFDSDGETTV